MTCACGAPLNSKGWCTRDIARYEALYGPPDGLWNDPALYAPGEAGERARCSTT